MDNRNQVSYAAQADRSAEARKQRLMREALGETRDPTSPIHVSFVVALVIMLLAGGTALMDDQAGAATSAQIAQSGSQFTTVAAKPEVQANSGNDTYRR